MSLRRFFRLTQTANLLLRSGSQPVLVLYQLPNRRVQLGRSPHYWSERPPRADARAGALLRERAMTNDTKLPSSAAHESTMRVIGELRTKLDEFAAELGHTLETSEQPVTAQQLKVIIRARRKRESMFPAGLFADPAWDMLLELYYAAKTQQRLTVSILCSKSAVPQSSALRWINKLEEFGLLIRVPDHLDNRRVFVELSPNGGGILDRYFSSLGAIIPAI